jgi:dienelactone hydrolase
MRTAAVLVLHHAQGLTRGVQAFAADIRHAGHTVHCPDLYDGKTFPTLDQGLAYARRIGLDTFTQRGIDAASRLGGDLVFIGFSLGVLPAQQLAQTRPAARGAVLLEACLPPGQFAGGWPPELPVQIHGMDHDPHFAGEGDLDNARALINQADHGELFLYPGNRHLFTDSSLASYQPAPAALVRRRVLSFLSS